MSNIVTDNNIDLFGWDTAYAISYDHVNEAIKKLRATPIGFKYEKEADDFSEGVLIEGKWGDWQLTTEGDGKNVTFKCPIISGIFKTNGKQFNFTDKSYIQIQFRLTYINQHEMDYIDRTAKTGSGQQKNLKVNTNKINDDDYVVAITDSKLFLVDKDNKELTDEQNKEIVDISNPLLKEWFENNLDKFEFIFSKFIVNQKANKEEFQWLKPTSVSYALASINKDLGKSVFGAMSMTEGRTNSNTTYEIDGNSLKFSKANSAFAISSSSFLEKCILSTLPTLISGTTKDNYELNDDGLTYTNKSKIEWTKFKDDDGKLQTASIDKGNLKFGIENNKIIFDLIDLNWQVKEGVTVHVNYTDYYEIGLKSGVDKYGKAYKNVFMVEPTKKPKLTVAFTVSDAERNKEIITGVLVGLGVGVLGGMLGGLVGDGAEALVNRLISKITSKFTQVASDEAVELEPILNDVVDEAGDNASDGDSLLDSQTTGGDTNIFEPNTFGNFISKNKWTIIGAVMGTLVGAAAGSSLYIVDEISKKNFSKLPTLDNFVENCVGALKWPNNSGFELTSANLFDGGLLLGGNLKFNKFYSTSIGWDLKDQSYGTDFEITLNEFSFKIEPLVAEVWEKSTGDYSQIGLSNNTFIITSYSKDIKISLKEGTLTIYSNNDTLEITSTDDGHLNATLDLTKYKINEEENSIKIISYDGNLEAILRPLASVEPILDDMSEDIISKIEVEP